MDKSKIGVMCTTKTYERILKRNSKTLPSGNLIHTYKLSTKSKGTNVNINSNYEDIGFEVGELVQRKQRAYGDSFGRSGDCLRQMFPNGIKPEQYDDLLTIARILDKLFRIANNPKAFNENPYQDIVGYGLLGMKRHMENHNERTE
jgi:hypothetical protein